MRLMASAAVVFACICVIPRHTEALNELTHALVNQSAGETEDFDRLLKSRFGFAQGVKQRFQGRTVSQSLGLGGIREDDGSLFLGTARYLRHFHDPLKPWDRSGLELVPFIQYESSIRWMQRPNRGAQSCRTGDWSWPEARRYYVDALTCQAPRDRERAWANLFRALGQVMHLVVDASVPEHVRNDPHPLGVLYGNYEYWAEAQHGTSQSPEESDFIRTYLAKPFEVDLELLQQPSADPVAVVPIARLIDTDTYDGTDPNQTLGLRIGIAEFANANFFSEDTGRHRFFSPGYRFPSLEQLVTSKQAAPKTGRIRAYYKKGANDGIPVDPALAECVLDQASEVVGIPKQTVLCTDERVWDQTARTMLPRAVGYARAVLDYFFRGRLTAKLDVWKDEAGLHATVRVTNQMKDEGLDGSLALYYDLADGTRKPLGSWPLALAANAESEPIQISPLPPDTPPTAWTLVFRGRLGLEEQAVVAGRVGRSYVGALRYEAVGDVERVPPFEDWSAFLPDPPALFDLDQIVRSASGGPGGVISLSPVSREKRYLIYYRNPLSQDETLEVRLLPSFARCLAWENIFYGDYFYRQFNSTSILAQGPAPGTLVVFDPPKDLATLFGYTYRNPPSGPTPIATLDGPKVLTAVADLRMFGVRLPVEAPDPGAPELLYPEGLPVATRTSWCIASAIVEFPE